VKNTQEKVKAGKSSPKIPSPITPAPAPQITQSPIGENSDLLDTHPIDACVELMHRLLTPTRTLLSGEALSRTDLKIVVLFVAEYGSTT
jgi:hypothetical protein